MDIFCTYCSKDKDEIIESLPAIHMYRSKRIRKVNESAKLLGYPFFILSGKYGLIPAEETIHYYDHLLTKNEVPIMTEKIADQLICFKIDSVVFFHNSTESHEKISPYIDTISNACKKLNKEIKFYLIDIPDEEDKSRNGFREIWHKAIKTNQKMVLSKDNSGMPFDNLFMKHPNDGMLFYERAEAYECLGDFDKAKNDYVMALFHFPNPKWKNVAYEGLIRIQNVTGNQKKRRKLDRRWNYFHRVHGFVYIPHNIRIFVLSALERYEEEKRLSIGELRICIEILTRNILSKYQMINFTQYQDILFCNKIDTLYKEKHIDIELCKLFKKCWFEMGKIIHPIKYEIISEENYEMVLNSFLRILEILNQKRLLLLE